MPYTPPSAPLQPPPLPEPGERRPGMSFGKRLLLTPLWFVLGLIPVFLVGVLVDFLRMGAGLALGVVLAVSFFIYRWLVEGLDWPAERRKVMAWIGVPLVAVAWGAFLFGVLFAMCSVIGGFNMH